MPWTVRDAMSGGDLVTLAGQPGAIRPMSMSGQFPSVHTCRPWLRSVHAARSPWVPWWRPSQAGPRSLPRARRPAASPEWWRSSPWCRSCSPAATPSSATGSHGEPLDRHAGRSSRRPSASGIPGDRSAADARHQRMPRCSRLDRHRPMAVTLRASAPGERRRRRGCAAPARRSNDGAPTVAPVATVFVMAHRFAIARPRRAGSSPMQRIGRAMRQSRRRSQVSRK